MKHRYFLLIGLVVFGLMLASCSTVTSQVPGQVLPLAPADYTVLGETSGAAQGTNILGLFWLGDQTFGEANIYGAPETTGGILSSLFKIGGTAEVKSNALYNALTQMPDADTLVNQKYEIKVTNYFVFKQYDVSVKATGVQYPEGNIVAK
ncbi:MAG: hypothetical protein LBL64_02270 [Treponema sp.]|nr:hypothetical protein [Treponema sp.]